MDFVLSAPDESTELTAKYHVPGVRSVVKLVVLAPEILALDEYDREVVPQKTLYPARFVNADPSTFWVGAVQLSAAARIVTVVIIDALPFVPLQASVYV